MNKNDLSPNKRYLEKTPADKPVGVLLALLMTSASSLNFNTHIIGPKCSSFIISISSVQLSIRQGVR